VDPVFAPNDAPVGKEHRIDPKRQSAFGPDAPEHFSAKWSGSPQKMPRSEEER
jgi:hypothetical protein